ncbi:hypothetical protein E5170_18300 [Pseudomonas atacamensis]|uniref:Uncharacterized protein n=1 Tax=Pseudomonas atacamensis TaxID=2565368 RepID=A0AAQ2HZS0_9PSED|nr:hypothetical protein EGJ55_17210 [Pseudomonas moraviensis]THF29155.1 hypothetical protein E5170_18300 [Pseudomonas atacamensis]
MANSRTSVLLGQAIFFGVCENAFASRLAPTGKCISTVGASLLAKGPLRTLTRPGADDGVSSQTLRNRTLRALCRCFSNVLCCPNCAASR